MTFFSIDLGARDHLTSEFSLFTSCKPIGPITISCPDHTFAIATHIGTIHISKDLALYNVLYVANFGSHLMSIPKLALSNNVNVFLSDGG